MKEQPKTRTDCQLYNGRTCIGLNKLYCKTEQCVFFQPGKSALDRRREQREAQRHG